MVNAGNIPRPPCRVCRAGSQPFGTAQVQGKYQVAYFRCEACGFVQTEEPYWLAEAYADAITATDVGLVRRNREMAAAAQSVILALFEPNAEFVDYGGGYGLLTRMLRDAGLRFFWYDRYCQNLFARGYEAEPSAPQRYALLTAFEVFEHLVDPLAELDSMLGLADSVLFSTNLIGERPPPLGTWWYYGLEHGQHVALYTLPALQALAAAKGLMLVSDGVSMHLFTRRPVSQMLFRLAVHQRLAPLVVRGLAWRQATRSLTFADQRDLLDGLVKRGVCTAATERSAPP